MTLTQNKQTMLTKIELQTLAQWDKGLNQCANPLGLTDEMVESMPDALEFQDATYLGRYMIPRAYVRYGIDSQPRKKLNDIEHISRLKISYEEYGVDTVCYPPVVALTDDSTNPFLVEGISGYHRDFVFNDMRQEMYVYDVYVFHSPWAKRMAKNKTNKHLRPELPQNRNDFLKEISAAIENSEIECDFDAIEKAVNEMCEGAGARVRRWVKREAANKLSNVSNFRAYNPEGKSSSSIYTFCQQQGIPVAGTVGRTEDQIEEQGCVTYFATNANNFSTWGRGFANSQEYNVPIIMFAYLANVPDDIQGARQSLLDEFIRVKDLYVSACFRVADSQPTGEPHYFPIKFGGFLPQYIKSSSSLGGLPTETTLVDVDGNEVEFSPDMPCLTER